MNIVICLLVADFEKNVNNKKNKVVNLNLIVDEKNNLIKEKFKFTSNIKEEARNKIKSIINSDNFHLEQVYTFGEEKYFKYEKSVDIMFVALINSDFVSAISNNYKLINISIEDNTLTLGNDFINYKTIKNISVNNIEYTHFVDVKDDLFEKKCIQIITCYKYVRIRSKYTDILFKLLPKKFTLEEVRILFQKILNQELDKSNFRKKIMKYCFETGDITTNVGYRPTKLYEFHVDLDDVWI